MKQLALEKENYELILKTTEQELEEKKKKFEQFVDERNLVANQVFLLFHFSLSLFHNFFLHTN